MLYSRQLFFGGLFYLIFISNLSADCGTITGVQFSNGTPITNGDVFLISDLPSSTTIDVLISVNPAWMTIGIRGAVENDSLQSSPPYSSDTFTPVPGTYTVIIKAYDSLSSTDPCEEKEVRFSIKKEPTYTFMEDAVDWGVNVDGRKDGGMAFGDYDNDGDLDLLINSDDNTTRSRLYRNNGDYTFTDVTSTLAPYMLTTTRERVAVWGDINNDGWLDYMRNTSFGGIEIYLQPSGGGVFGDGLGGSTPLIYDANNISNGVNTEGAGMLDFDGDGDLDVIFDNHNYGIDVLRNNYVDHTTGTVVNPPPGLLFTHATPGTGTSLGLAQSAIDGDYGSFTDVNDDGWVDIFMRKQGENDFFLNQGGTFTNGADLAEASNGNKGAVNLYDYDNDGDFDAFWTDNGDNQIFRNDNGTWVPLGATTGIPTTFQGNTIDEVASGDIDNDGDIDILLVGDKRSQLYINQLNDPVLGRNTGTAMSFVLSPAFTFHEGSDGEGASMIDIDNDGDLDVYINIFNKENVLYINDLYGPITPEVSKNYLFVKVIDDRPQYMQAGQERLALGATVVLEDCSGNVISGIRELNGGTGHGTQDPPVVHFGLVDGPDYSYRVVVKYPNWKNPSTGLIERKQVTKWIRPSEVTSFPVTIEFRPSDADIYCPVEICDNGIDDDFDFKTDCEDEDCEGVVDIDGDGLASWCDLDDDNDGILDTDEGFCSDYLTMIRWTHNANDPDPGDPDGHSKPFYEDQIVLSGSIETSGSGVVHVNPGLSFVEVNGINTSSFAEAQAAQDYLEYTFTTQNDFGNKVYHFDAYGTYITPANYGSSSDFGVSMSTDNFVTSQEIEVGVPYLSSNGGNFDFRLINPQYRYQLEENTTYTFRVYFYNLRDGDRLAFDDFTIYVCSSEDTDGDGIANHEDTDSDNDDCLDALEGGLAFTEDDLESDYLAGPQDENGVPIVANGGQTVFESQDADLKSACIACKRAIMNPHIMYFGRN